MTADVGDRFVAAGAVADAVLYEGYVLYPYRASSNKNRMRWQFGVLAPRAFSEEDGSERWSTRTECLLDPGPAAVLSVRIRFLHAQHRGVERATQDGIFVPVGSLAVDGHRIVEWDEAVDHVIDVPPLPLGSLLDAAHHEDFARAGGTVVELVRTGAGEVAGRTVRQRQRVDGRVEVAALRMPGGGRFVKVVVTVENAGRWAEPGARRDAALARSLIAVHTMVAVDDGGFVSLLDPPDHAVPAVATCRSDGAFPVLVGHDDVVLSSPIILYDHPEIAPESPGDLYDATEIDEILALRVLTLTDEEKAEARGTDPRAAAIVDRCDDMAGEVWERLHGAVRTLRPAELRSAGTKPQGPPEPVQGPPEPGWWDPEADASFDPWSDSVCIGDVEARKGVPVRLRPSRRSDAQDIFLGGLTATVAGVFTNVDGQRQVAVTIDDDPATAELAWQGRYLFFHPDEVEPLVGEVGSR